jgi:hypothetical protein
MWLRSDWRLFDPAAAVARLNGNRDPDPSERWLAEIGIFRPGGPHLSKAAPDPVSRRRVRLRDRRTPGVSAERVRVSSIRYRLIGRSPAASRRTPLSSG